MSIFTRAFRVVHLIHPLTVLSVVGLFVIFMVSGCGVETSGPEPGGSTSGDVGSGGVGSRDPGSADDSGTIDVQAAERFSVEDLVETRLGGDTTVSGVAALRFGAPIPGIDGPVYQKFLLGERLFQQPWSVAPGRDQNTDGLGPLFNATSCAACHISAGRGLPPHPSSQLIPLGLLLRLSIPGVDAVTGGPVGDPVYGLQLQDRAGPQLPAEGKLAVTYETVVGQFGDGSTFILDAPTYTVSDLAFGTLHDDVMMSPRFAQQVIGLGLLEAIPDDVLLAAADPDDLDGDGISGRINMVWDDALETAVIGRFGWKANLATVEIQVADAFHGDLGITSVHRPDEECPPQTPTCTDALSGAADGQHELTSDQLAMVTLYNRTLAVPAARDGAAVQVKKGASVFLDLGCAACHTPVHETGDSDLEALSNQTIAPYTDLLLHDMGDGLADGRPDFLASGSEWRTPPLWGLGLIDDTSGERFLLHDGRAATIEAAILWHGGEAEPAREAFRLAPADDREALIAFLETR